MVLAAAPRCISVSVKSMAVHFPQLLAEEKRKKCRFFVMINGSHPTRKELSYA